MKNNSKHKGPFKASVLMILCLVLVVFTACDYEYELPEANSKADETPPQANFSATVTDDFLTYTFGNSSTSATDYLWDYGDGNTSTGVDGINTFPDEGTYTVSLTASDKLGVSSTYKMVIEVVEPEVPDAIVPKILNPSFDEPGDNGKYTSPWVDSNMGKTIQISSSSSFVGGKAGKFPDAVTNTRVAYQKDIAVTPNTEYAITYNYSIETGAPSSVIVAILGGTVTSLGDAAAATLKSHTGTIQAGKTPFETVTITFNSGANNSISILITNTGTETGYVEEFKAAVNE
ncbi:PKD domain-containing protein [Flavobacteriaceae bacterium F08102]|nr:PKD domain-containing protein [Flavobacteriaceae bacterium F08102]